MTKQEALDHFGGSAQRLAEALRLSRQAVHQWPADEPVPELRRYQIMEIVARRNVESA